jgi:hypothetical protein
VVIVDSLPLGERSSFYRSTCEVDFDPKTDKLVKRRASKKRRPQGEETGGRSRRYLLDTGPVEPTLLTTVLLAISLMSQRLIEELPSFGR